MAQASAEDVATLRARVTSPGGTTAAAIASFDDADTFANIKHAVRAAYDRAQQLAAKD